MPAVMRQRDQAFAKTPLPGATTDDMSCLQPCHFIWMKSAQGWVAVLDGVMTLEGQT
jgi:hypothetical protein